MATMDGIILVESEDSDNSIVEVEVPKKEPPPVIDIVDDDIILNVAERKQETVLAKDIIEVEVRLSKDVEVMSKSNNIAKNSRREKKSLSLINPVHWTSDMIKFYNDDWGNEEDFIVEKMQRKMNKNPSLWEMSRRDIMNMHDKGRHRGVKCWNCGQHGHQNNDCPDPPYEIRCHMCGLEGHRHYSCPLSKCLNCGRPNKKYITSCKECKKDTNETCSRCLMIGHDYVNCSDHWRLFHLTTNSVSVVIPDKNMNRSVTDLWCCNCGRQGHDQTKCYRRNDLDSFTVRPPFVISYEKEFNEKLKHKMQKLFKGNRYERKEAYKLSTLNPKTRKGNHTRKQIKSWRKQRLKKKIKKANVKKEK